MVTNICHDKTPFKGSTKLLQIYLCVYVHVFLNNAYNSKDYNF